MKRNLSSIGLTITLIVAFVIFLSSKAKDDFVGNHRLIAHAGGGVGEVSLGTFYSKAGTLLDGRTYTNSLQALTTNYRKGFRAF